MEVLETEKILVIQTAFIGDAVLSLPMIQKLKEICPSCSIDVICIPATEEIFKANPFVNDAIVYDKRGKQRSILSLFGFAKTIRKRSYSRIYSLHRSFRTALLVKFSGVKDTYGFSNSALKNVYKNIIDYHLERHEVQRGLNLIGLDSDCDWRITPIIMCDEKTKNKVDSVLSSIEKQKIIAIAPGSVWETKKYPIDYFCQLIERLNKTYKILLIGGKSDSGLCENISTRFDQNVISSAGKFNIPGTVELLKRCELLITNDSAPTHFAMAADIPAITIYCSTIPEFGFYPYNKNSCSITYNQLECKPCGIHGHKKCPNKTFDCANKIDIETILNKINEILDDRKK